MKRIAATSTLLLLLGNSTWSNAQQPVARLQSFAERMASSRAGEGKK